MKAATHEAEPDEQSPESAFQRFAKTVRALVAVPKRELEEKLAQSKASRDTKRKTRRE
jgi:hypothetical protein